MRPWTRSFSIVTSFSIANARRRSQPSFQIFRDVPPLRHLRHQLLLANRTVGLVPTMGALHEGHLSLIRQAAAENTDVVVSIYVNPTQFGVSEDLSSYPRTWESDLEKLEILNNELGKRPSNQQTETAFMPAGRIAAVLAPTTKVMYRALPPTSELNGDGSFVTITPLARKLEGASRPVFFRGVATVCMKLFNIVTPDRVYFGQKDIQQCTVIKRMVKDFHIDTEVRIGPTVREPDGLAMSSRNVYLGTRRRAVGLALHKALKAAEAAFMCGEHERTTILGAAKLVTEQILTEQKDLAPSQRALFEVDYISLANPESLDEINSVNPATGAILSGAIKMFPLEDPRPDEDCGLGSGTTAVRLIDNIILKKQN